MEKKYPVLKCNEELWNEIKPVLESFGIIDFSNLGDSSDKNNLQFDRYPYLVTNYGNHRSDKFSIGNVDYSYGDKFNTLRYFVDTKEEFLSAIAKLLGKEYPIKKQYSKIKYPCIKCTQQLYDKIKDILEIVGYKESNFTDFRYEDILIVNLANEFGQISNVSASFINDYNRYLCSNIQEFLTKACELKGYTVSYINNTHCNDAENHYFGYCVNNETKTISIYENAEEGGLQSIVVEKSVVPEKKKENDLNIDKDMEKINIVNKLKHCKKGTKLYSPIFGEVEFDSIENNAIYVNTINNDNKIVRMPFESNGQFYSCYPNGECLLFPSKDNRNWNNFQVLEEGHRVMVSNNGENWSLRKYYMDDEAYRFSDDADSCNSHIYIVPVEDFDFTAEDITINKEKSII